jgi:hypothetical protein
MTPKGSHLESRAEAIGDGKARRISIPLVPTLLGALAVVNVASVVLVLIE